MTSKEGRAGEELATEAIEGGQAEEGGRADTRVGIVEERGSEREAEGAEESRLEQEPTRPGRQEIHFLPCLTHEQFLHLPLRLQRQQALWRAAGREPGKKGEQRKQEEQEQHQGRTQLHDEKRETRVE